MALWGIYPWVAERGIELLHPDDLEKFKREVSGCKVFECIDKGEYITLKYNNNCYRVKNTLFKSVSEPKFKFGEVVKIRRTGEEVIVTDIMWHFNNHEHYYFVCTLNKNKKKSKRYFESELL